MSETTNFNPNGDNIKALLSKVSYEGVSVGYNFLNLAPTKFSEDERNYLKNNFDVIDS